MIKKPNDKGSAVHSPTIPASTSKRVFANLIDIIFLSPLVYISSIIFDISTMIPGPFWVGIIALTGYFYFFFTVIPHTIFSQTLGQCVMRIKVVTRDQKRLKFLSCLIRDLVLKPLILIEPSSVTHGNGVGIHDRIIGSKVVEAK